MWSLSSQPTQFYGLNTITLYYHSDIFCFARHVKLYRVNKLNLWKNTKQTKADLFKSIMTYARLSIEMHIGKIDWKNLHIFPVEGTRVFWSWILECCYTETRIKIAVYDHDKNDWLVIYSLILFNAIYFYIASINYFIGYCMKHTATLIIITSIYQHFILM